MHKIYVFPIPLIYNDSDGEKKNVSHKDIIYLQLAYQMDT